MQYSVKEDNSAASETLPPAGGSGSSEVSVTRFVSAVNCKCPAVSDAGVDDKDVADVYDSWLPKLAADSPLAGSSDELTNGSGRLSLTEPSSSQVGSIVTVVSQNHITADCLSYECSMGADDGLKDGMQNSCGKDFSDAQVLKSAGKLDSQPGCDGGAGMS